jgi:Raf kinase inhibitor-like YbhB/YbcL family protein
MPWFFAAHEVRVAAARPTALPMASRQTIGKPAIVDATQPYGFLVCCRHDANNTRVVKATLGLITILTVGLLSCRNSGDDNMAKTTMQMDVEAMQVLSSAFKEEEMIPRQYTCDGEDISPPLSWEAGPEATQSIALIVDDPDAPRGTFVHWVLYDLPGNVRELPEDVPSDKTLPNGGKQGVNSAGTIGYSGPCPPSGTHRYFFKVYALDAPTNLPPGKSKDDLLQVMDGHILAQGQIMGTYRRR